MNSPQPLKQENLVTGSSPTVGAAIGAGVGSWISTKTGMDPTTVIIATTAIFTALFHWLGNKIGVNL